MDRCAQAILKHGGIIIAEDSQPWIRTGATDSDPQALSTRNCHILHGLRRWVTYKHKAANMIVGLFPIVVAMVLCPAAASASESIAAAKACPPTTHRLYTIALRGTSENPEPDKLNPKNHTRNVRHPFERESSRGISLIRRGETEYCQIMVKRRIVPKRLSRDCVTREDNSMRTVET